ncbi:MAG: hypothetical protein ABSC55_01940 [Syntrophorhabdales bacterium]|jgi:hypothetical protein
MDDIRIKFSFLTHRKRKRLEGLLGAQGVLSLNNLWISAAQTRSKGVLYGMDETDIALDAQWPGRADEFCKALVDIGWLDRSENGVYSLHDWEEHQPYVFHSEERSAQAKEAVQTRWRRKAKDRDEIPPEYDPYTDRNTPSPNPSPSPEKEIKEKIKEGSSSSFSKNLQTKRRFDDGKPYPTDDSF